MNKTVWLVLIVGVAVLVGVVIFFPRQPVSTPAIIPLTDKTESVKTSPTVATPVPVQQPQQDATPTKIPSAESTTESIKQPEAPQLPPREHPTEKQFLLCEHIISGVTQYGFTGEIRLINKGKKTVNGWSVTWQYDDGSMIIDAEDVALSGNNPYTGEYLDWNAEIKPGETVKFKFSGLLGGEGGAPTNIRVTGDSCM